MLSVNFSHCSTNLSRTGMSGRGKTGSGKVWLSELCERGGKFRGGELFEVIAPLEEILSCTLRKGLILCFRPVRLCLFRSRRFAK